MNSSCISRPKSSQKSHTAFGSGFREETNPRRLQHHGDLFPGDLALFADVSFDQDTPLLLIKLAARVPGEIGDAVLFDADAVGVPAQIQAGKLGRINLNDVASLMLLSGPGAEEENVYSARKVA
jgi:hypothetical protein